LERVDLAGVPGKRKDLEMELDPDVLKGRFLGSVIRYCLAAVVIALTLKFVFHLAWPMIQELGTISSEFGGNSGHGFYNEKVWGLGALCVVIIGVVAALKVTRR
jgi:hypothetical protein